MCNSMKYLVKLLIITITLNSCVSSQFKVGKNPNQPLTAENYSLIKGEYLQNISDTTKSIRITPIDKNTINVDFSEYGEDYDGYQLKGSYQNGYFVSNWNKKHNKIFWYIIHSHSKSRQVIGLSKNNQLLMGSAAQGSMYFVFFPFFTDGTPSPLYTKHKKHITHW